MSSRCSPSLNPSTCPLSVFSALFDGLSLNVLLNRSTSDSKGEASSSSPVADYPTWDSLSVLSTSDSQLRLNLNIEVIHTICDAFH